MGHHLPLHFCVCECNAIQSVALQNNFNNASTTTYSRITSLRFHKSTCLLPYETRKSSAVDGVKKNTGDIKDNAIITCIMLSCEERVQSPSLFLYNALFLYLSSMGFRFIPFRGFSVKSSTEKPYDVLLSNGFGGKKENEKFQARS